MQGFENSISQLKAYEKFLSVYLAEYMDKVVRQKAVSDTPFEKYKGLVVSMEEAENVFVPVEFSLSDDGKKLAADIFSEIEECSSNSAQSGIFLPLDYICKQFGFGLLERFIIALAAMPLINTEYEKTFGYINDNVNLTAPTLEFAIDLLANGDKSVVPKLTGKLLKYIFVPSDSNVIKSRLKLRDYFSYLLSCGKFQDNIPCMELKALDEQGFICYKKQAEEITDIMNSGAKMLVFIDGKDGSGRKHLLMQCAYETGNPVLFIDFEQYLAVNDKDSVCTDIICQLLLRQCYICVCGIKSTDDKKKQELSNLCKNISKAATTIFLCGEKRENVDVPLNLPLFSVKLDELTRTQRYEIWQTSGFENVDFIHETANKYRFTPKQICSAASYAFQKAKINGMEMPDEEMLEMSCREQTEGALGDKAKLIKSEFTLDDLILPDEEKQQIKEACNHIKYRHIVYDKWNFDSLLPYGKGLVILFAGPPGTGKTMAATIVAREIGLSAYRVDLSQIMSKYIGETEKSLGEIFDIAERNNSVLFFDETDALFGKRSEIKDSHDKYANVETSYLLQRLESFDGIVLMSTNLLQNIDEAFMRRISYIVHFPFPDKAQRLVLWKKMFPPEMPVDSGIDFDYLAGQFELSGAVIKNTVMSAAFLAADEEKNINMSHLLKAVKKQLSKQGKIFLKEDFGKYSMFV